MSNSSLVNYTKISPNKTSPRQDSIKKITIHHMAGNLTVEACGNIFAPESRQASANYGIGTDGRVGLYVDEKDRAWTSSNPDNDNQAVTIEVANNSGEPNWTVSDAAFNKLIDLCVDICIRNNIKELIWTGDKNGTLTCHYMFAATACPGPYLKSRMAEIAELVNKRIRSTTTITIPDSTVTYRVRKSWENVKSQVGAYTILDNAKKAADSNPGYYVFDEGGKIVYPVKSTNIVDSSRVVFPTTPFSVNVIVTDLNIRKTPSSKDSSNLTGKTTGKGIFTITEVQDGWGKLKSGAGWIYLENPAYCTVGKTITNNSASTQTKPSPSVSSNYQVKVTASVLNIRKGPGATYAISGQIKNQGVYTIVQTSGNWGKLLSGAGWICLDYTNRI